MMTIMEGFGYTSKESGAWLQALPTSSLGLRLDDSTLRDCCGAETGHYNLCGSSVLKLQLGGGLSRHLWFELSLQ